MTCVIATPRGVWADRKITADTWEVCEPVSKVASNEHMAAGFAGPFGGIVKAVDAVKGGASLQDLAAVCDTSKLTGLAVADGRLYVLEVGRVWPRKRNSPWYAVGSGGELALAFLAGGGAPVDALRYVSKHRDDCGRGWRFAEAP